MSIKNGNAVHQGIMWGMCCVMPLLPITTVIAQSAHETAISRPSPPPNPLLQNATQAATTTTPTTGMGTSAVLSPVNGTPMTNTRTQQGRNSDRHNVGSGALLPPMGH
jgi:hypothetical protein